MSGTGKRGPDRLNMIGVVTVGVCGAVLTYVSIVLLTAYYMNDTSQIERQNAVEAPGSLRETVKAATTNHLDGQKEGTIPISRAMELVIADAAKDASNLVPGVGPSTQPTVNAEYGRPVDLAKPAAAPAAPAPTEPTPAPAPTPTETAPSATPPATTPTPAESPAAPATAPSTTPAAAPSTAPAAPAAKPAATKPKPAATKPKPAATKPTPATGAPTPAPGANGP